MYKRILILEDDASYGAMLKTWFVKNDWLVSLVTKVGTAQHELSSNAFNLVLSDLRLPDGDGILLLTWMRENFIMTPFIVMTGYGDVQTAVDAIKLGAFDYLCKPINPSVLQQKIDMALLQKEEKKNEKRPVRKMEEKKMITGCSAVMQRVYNHVSLVAPTNISVLILGESGTGKEYIARMIHEKSRRASKPFVAVDCGSLSMELAPSELFGHLKGSFTSAISDKRGVFEEAEGGTVFLDEVGNLPYEVQKQLLRALQEQKVRPVGSVVDVKVDVRIIAATNENLERAIEEGRFRQDLYHRINEFSINVPPLRERIEDLEEFAYHFVKQADDELGKSIVSISDEALSILKQQKWSGNLRELRNVIRRSVLFAQNDIIMPEDLPVFSQQKDAVKQEEENYALQPGNEKEQILSALHKSRGNKTLAAQLLQIDRKTLYNKIHLYNIEL
ncbi:MAG TPA: sigma-54 dependent transcriptional regulator [Bacteroidetes bacterium]|nr:sigma-54 dependent transcriptional regulator [Candidatus Limimorpha avicola]